MPIRQTVCGDQSSRSRDMHAHMHPSYCGFPDCGDLWIQFYVVELFVGTKIMRARAARLDACNIEIACPEQQGQERQTTSDIWS